MRSLAAQKDNNRRKSGVSRSAKSKIVQREKDEDCAVANPEDDARCKSRHSFPEEPESESRPSCEVINDEDARDFGLWRFRFNGLPILEGDKWVRFNLPAYGWPIPPPAP